MIQLIILSSQLSAIEEDDSLTPRETFEQIKAKIDSYSPQLRDLVIAAGPHPPRGGPKVWIISLLFQL